MAEASISVEHDQFSCPVCLDLLKDPVTIPCGHSYCMSCIKGCWKQEDQKRVYSCPQCRKIFIPKPMLGKNTILAEIVEKLKKTKISAAVPAGAGDVQCDICTGRKCKAVKSCLVCLESYCQTHFDRHEEFRSVKPHKVTDATEKIKQMICPQHGKQLEIYCRTDQCCICCLCTVSEHKNHRIVTATTEKTSKQKHLEQTQRIFKHKIQEKEKDLRELKDVVKNHKQSTQATIKNSERIFTELICSIERSRSKVTQLIKSRETAVVSKAERLMEQMEKEIDGMKAQEAEMEQLLQTNHHILFLQIAIKTCISYDDVRRSVKCLQKKLEDFCTESIGEISGKVRYIDEEEDDSEDDDEEEDDDDDEEVDDDDDDDEEDHDDDDDDDDDEDKVSESGSFSESKSRSRSFKQLQSHPAFSNVQPQYRSFRESGSKPRPSSIAQPQYRSFRQSRSQPRHFFYRPDSPH